MVKAFSSTPTRFQRMLTVLAVFVAVILVFACLYWAKTVLIPVALAILLAFLLAPVVTAIQRRGLPRVPAVLLVVVLAAGVLAGVGWLLTSQLTALAYDLPTYEDNIRRKVADVRQFFEGGAVERVTDTVERVTEDLNEKGETKGTGSLIPTVPVALKADDNQGALERLGQRLGPVLEPLLSGALVLALVIFMLIKREDMRNRLIRLLGPENLTLATKAMDDAGTRISRYLLTQLILNTSFGVLVGIGLFFIGVPYAILWGFFAGLLRYIPYLGAYLGALVPIAFSIVIFDGWTQPLLVAGLFLALEPLFGMVLEPLLYGHQVGASEAALLVALAFWTWIWGPVGLILAMPMTVCLVVLGQYVPYLRFFEVLLGAEPALSPEVRFYQRLLARDQDEALSVLEEEREKRPVEEVYDEVLLPALAYTKRDAEAGLLTAEEEASIVGQAGEIVRESRKWVPAAPEGTEVLSEAAGCRVKLLACALGEEADDVALQMLTPLLDPKRCEVVPHTSEMLSSEVMGAVGEEGAPVVCLAAMPPGGVGRMRYLCKRLRERFPDLKIITARWGGGKDRGEDESRLLEAGADHFGVTIRETAKQVMDVVKILACREESPAGRQAAAAKATGLR